MPPVIGKSQDRAEFRIPVWRTSRSQDRPLDRGLQRADQARCARLRGNTRGCDGGQELATAIGPRCHCDPLAPTVKREAEEDWGRW